MKAVTLVYSFCALKYRVRH